MPSANLWMLIAAGPPKSVAPEEAVERVGGADLHEVGSQVVDGFEAVWGRPYRVAFADPRSKSKRLLKPPEAGRRRGGRPLDAAESRRSSESPQLPAGSGVIRGYARRAACSSWTVRSAVGRDSRRSSGIGFPLSTDSP
jgi:hypothetical protein